MNLRRYKAIIFDLGGVLIDIDYHKTLHAFEQLGIKDAQALYSQANQTSLFDGFEVGEISTQQYINKVKDYTNSSVTPNEIVAAWNAMLLEFDPNKLAFLLELRKSIPIYLLSNTNAIHEDKFRRKLKQVTDMPLEAYFDKVYLSHEIGARKPHSNTFKYVCSDAKLEPSSTLFIDDSHQHITGAQSIGLETMLFPQNASFSDLFFFTELH